MANSAARLCGPSSVTISTSVSAPVIEVSHARIHSPFTPVASISVHHVYSSDMYCAVIRFVGTSSNGIPAEAAMFVHHSSRISESAVPVQYARSVPSDVESAVITG